MFRVSISRITHGFEAITASEKAGRSREASQLMEDMASAGLLLDAIAFSACISACTQAVRGDFPRAY